MGSQPEFNKLAERNDSRAQINKTIIAAIRILCDRKGGAKVGEQIMIGIAYQ